MTAPTTPSTPTSRYPSRTSTGPALIPREEPAVWGRAGAGPLDAVRLEAYDRAGFLELDDLLGDDELATFQAEVNRLMRELVPRGDERIIAERGSGEIRSVFAVHELSPTFAGLFADRRILDPVRQILGSEVYIHQSRVNRKPGFRGKEFYWHSDFETWHIEDGMPGMRAVSVSIALSDNRPDNGSLMIMPGSHRTFVSCVGETPENHYQQSLRQQDYGVPDDASLTRLAAAGGITTFTGRAGSATLFDCNCMHGSNGNITPYGRCNLFVVYNSVDNALVDPFSGLPPRPDFLGARTVEPLVPR